MIAKLMLVAFIAAVQTVPPPKQTVPPKQTTPPKQAPPPSRLLPIPGTTPIPGTEPGAAKVISTPPQGSYEMVSDIGVFVIVVKADKAAGFDAAMARIKAALLLTKNPARKLQALGWRVFKSDEPPTDGKLTYFFFIDPSVKQISYDPITIMRETLPAEVQTVFDQLKDAWVSATRIGLKEVVRMGGGS